MVKSGEAAETRFYLAVVCGKGDAEVGVVGWFAALVVVGLVDGVEKVCGDDEDVYNAAVGVEPNGAGGGLGVAGANSNAIVDGLNPRGCELLWENALAIVMLGITVR